MTLEQIIKIQEQLKLELVTPLVLDYNIIKSSLFDLGYRGGILDDMSITKLKSKYIHNKIDKSLKY